MQEPPQHSASSAQAKKDSAALVSLTFPALSLPCKFTQCQNNNGIEIGIKVQLFIEPGKK
jgi:hypothetical protein